VTNLGHTDARVITESIDLLEDMVRGYYTSKIIIQCAGELMTNYRQSSFVSTSGKHRKKFYFCLAQMWFNEDHIMNVDTYLAPLGLVC